jgi:3-oxoacyl-[acyl-carrier-protein] synthase II
MAGHVVVTGIGCISSLGCGVHEFAGRLLEGRSGVAPIDAFDTTCCRSHRAALITGFQPEAHLDPARIRRVDRIGRLALAACRFALDDGRFGEPGGPDRDRVGVVLGSDTAGVRSTVEYLEQLIPLGPAGVSAMGFSNTVGNAAASLCGIEFGLRGPNVTLSHKEASAHAALAFALGLLRHDRAAIVVAGGIDEVEPVFFAAHDRFGALSPSGGGDEASRPFDRRRNGFVFGEGAFLLVLESRESAASRGVTWYGEVLGVGATASACRLNDWPTEGSGLARAMRLALDDAGLSPAGVDVVFAAANSTPRLDRIEAEALRDVFGPGGVPVVSIKGAIGEFGASGAASAAAALLCLRQGRIPPTTGCDEPDVELGVDVAAAARAIRSQAPVALVNSFASGGANYSLVVRVNVMTAG